MSTASIAKRAMIPGIQESKTGRLQAIASRTLSAAKEVANEFQIEHAYGAYDELLADPAVDAVYIPLPNHLHKEWVIKAAEAGKHVLCEKPISLNAEEAIEMKEACERAGVLLAEAFMYRYQPRYTDIKAAIKDGVIGEIRGMHGTFTFNGGGNTTNFRANREMGGGGLYDIGVYPISAARMLLDEEPEAATVHAFLSEQHDRVDMMAAGLLEFSNGKALTFDCGMWAQFRNTLEILGTKGRIEIPSAFIGPMNYTIVRGDQSEEVQAIPSINMRFKPMHLPRTFLVKASCAIKGTMPFLI